MLCVFLLLTASAAIAAEWKDVEGKVIANGDLAAVDGRMIVISDGAKLPLDRLGREELFLVCEHLIDARGEKDKAEPAGNRHPRRRGEAELIDLGKLHEMFEGDDGLSPLDSTVNLAKGMHGRLHGKKGHVEIQVSEVIVVSGVPSIRGTLLIDTTAIMQNGFQVEQATFPINMPLKLARTLKPGDTVKVTGKLGVLYADQEIVYGNQARRFIHVMSRRERDQRTMLSLFLENKEQTIGARLFELDE